MDPILSCPHCGKDIKLTESLAAPMVAAVEEKHRVELAQKDKTIADKESALSVEQDELAARHKQLEETVQKKVTASQNRIRVEEAEKAGETVMAEVKEMREQLVAQTEKLADAQKGQAALLRKQREFDEKERELELTVEKKIQDGLADARATAEKAAVERLGLRVREKEEVISSMAKQMEDLRRKAEQGSQQLQGEVQELQLEEMLKAKFPDDSIEPVPKGVAGGDALQRVVFGNQECGTILWESKRTKTWSNTWLPKLREDQRAAKADISIIVSQTLPKGMETLFDVIDGVWVCGPPVAAALAAVMRDGLGRVAARDIINAGMETKAELVYQYLTGSQFKRRIEAIVEAFTTMKEDLDKEKRAITKLWSKREAQLDRTMQATVGMHGDLQGIAGAAIHEVEGLEMKVLEA